MATTNNDTTPEAAAMSAAEFRLCLDRLQWTQEEAAIFFDCTTRTIWRYANGGGPVPRPIALLLRLMCAKHNPLTPEHVAGAPIIIEG